MGSKDWVRKQPIIHFNEIVRRLRSRGYAKVLVYRLVKSGHLVRVAKGIYSASDNPFEVASNIYYPSYISFLSASYRHGFTETIPRIMHVVSNKVHKALDFQGYSIEFIKSREVSGYHKDGNEFIADVEKLMVDAFSHPECVGNFDEITNIFSKSERIDVNMLKRYLEKLGSGKVYRCVGYMLEKYKNEDIFGFMPIDKNYYNLDPFKPGKKINKKWRLRI